MKKFQKTAIYVVTILFLCASLNCSKSEKDNKATIEKINPESTIGSVVTITEAATIPVEGYNIVGGLNGTGSSECPSTIRDYLTKYIHARLPKFDVEEFIASPNTAVVKITGNMPTSPLSSKYFDVKVEALPGTQTTSLKGGIMYGTELKINKGFFSTLPVLAKAEGPIFINPFEDSNGSDISGYILAGGSREVKFKISMTLKKPDFKMANFISNRLKARFGDDTAIANSPQEISLSIPLKYTRQQQRFIEIVKATYLNESPELTQQRIQTHIQRLADSTGQSGYQSEIVLETLGKASLGKLEPLLNSSNELVRLRAARCMLNLDNVKPIGILRQIANDVNSNYRIEALEAITVEANKKDASNIARLLLRDKDFKIRLAAYQQLEQMNDVSITRIPIRDDFTIELIPQALNKDIYVTRSGERKIVIFGSPVQCVAGALVSSNDGSIMVTADPNNEFVSVIRTHPTQIEKIIKIKSSFNISDIAETLCKDLKTGGLNVSYDDAILLLKKLCDKKQVDAQFHAGPLPQ